MQEIINKAREWAFAETEKFGTPYTGHLDLAFNVGQRLASELGVNKDIVAIGTYLMDIKLGQARAEGKIESHIQMSVEATTAFLKEFDISEEVKEKIVNCVAGHHGTIKYNYLEAEICANADCYRFLHPQGLFGYFILHGSRSIDFNSGLEKAIEKTEEKWNILSLDICKKELETYYLSFKKLLGEAKK